MSKTWCTGQGVEVELTDYPFQTVTCPVCGRSGLGAENVQSCLSQPVGTVPKHGANKLGPTDIPEVSFKPHDWEHQQRVLENYKEYRRGIKR